MKNRAKTLARKSAAQPSVALPGASGATVLGVLTLDNHELTSVIVEHTPDPELHTVWVESVVKLEIGNSTHVF